MRPFDTGGWSFGWDAPLIWPQAGLFTPHERAALIALRGRVLRGQCNEHTPELRRWNFYRWAVQKRGLFSG